MYAYIIDIYIYIEREREKRNIYIYIYIMHIYCAGRGIPSAYLELRYSGYSLQGGAVGGGMNQY